ncbi:MAG: neutral/alkaline non-lysosomal ceramidase N-terminal domain-containing protein [Planctomycetota bacterium]|nr:neutral/alkaline non-lysosomal ceramidase N-terminal domain-containing protein [Planctomycetota bacterium]
MKTRTISGIAVFQLALLIVGVSLGECAPMTAGAAQIEITPGKGVPLGGYGGGKRRLKRADFNPFNSHTFLAPATGVLDPLYAKALVIKQGKEKVCLLTIDAIAVEGDLVSDAVKAARKQGFTLKLDSVLACASHTHSGSGAVAKSLLWQLSAMDLLKARVRRQLVKRLATVMVKAEKAAVSAKLAVGTVDVLGATKNRRHKLHASILRTHIDPQLGVLRVDNAQGKAIATLWNFAIHGTMHGTGNDKFSADVMGLVNTRLEKEKMGVVLFMNGAEGDMAPSGGPAAAKKLAKAVMKLHGELKCSDQLKLANISKTITLGRPRMTVTEETLAQLEDDPLGFKNVLGRFKNGLTVPLSTRWVEHSVRLQGIRIGNSVILTMPGEPIAELGMALRKEVKALGYQTVLLASLANNHIGYILTEKEFKRGGYEAVVSFFGEKAGEKLKDECRKIAAQLK